MDEPWWDNPMMDEEVELRLIGQRAIGHYQRNPDWVHVTSVGTSAALYCRRKNPTSEEREARLVEMIQRNRR